MPGIHGRELIVRCEAIRPALPIVCMTGFAGEDEPAGVVGRRAALLSKPFSPAALKLRRRGRRRAEHRHDRGAPSLAPLDRVAAGYAAVYFACLALSSPASGAPHLSTSRSIPSASSLGWANWRNSHASGWTQDARAWQLLGAVALVLWVTGSLWTFWLTLFGPSLFTDLIDRAALSNTSSRSRPTSTSRRARAAKAHRRFALDVAFIVGGRLRHRVLHGARCCCPAPDGTMVLRVVESSLDWALFVRGRCRLHAETRPAISASLRLLLVANLMRAGRQLSCRPPPTYRQAIRKTCCGSRPGSASGSPPGYAWHHYGAEAPRLPGPARTVSGTRSAAHLRGRCVRAAHLPVLTNPERPVSAPTRRPR